MRVNVHNEYTYTLETIVQAGRNKMAITSIPVSTNPELRKSRLMNSIFSYIKKSVLTILRAVLMYKPLQIFTVLGLTAMVGGVAIGIRFMIFFFQGNGGGHTQSLILAAMLIIIGSQTLVTGMQADIISANRKLLEDIQYRVKKLEFGLLDPEGRAVTEQKDSAEKPNPNEYE